MDNILRRVNEELGTVGTPYEVTQVIPVRISLSDYYCLGVGLLTDGVLRATPLVDSETSKLIKLNCTAVANLIWTSTKDVSGWATISELIGLSDKPALYNITGKIPLSTASMQYINQQAAQLVNQRFKMVNAPVGPDAVIYWLESNTSHRPASVYGLVGNSLSDGILAGFREEEVGSDPVYYYIQNTDGQGYKRYLYLQCSVDGLNGYVEDCRWTTILPEGASNWQALEVTDQQLNELRSAYNMIGNNAIKLKYEHS